MSRHRIAGLGVLPHSGLLRFYIAGKFPMFIVWVNERNVKKKGARDSFYFGTGRRALLLLWLTSRGNSPSRSKPAYFVRKGVFTQRAILALAEWTPGQRTVAAWCAQESEPVAGYCLQGAYGGRFSLYLPAARPQAERRTLQIFLSLYAASPQRQCL